VDWSNRPIIRNQTSYGEGKTTARSGRTETIARDRRDGSHPTGIRNRTVDGRD
jgi:hypothetical protein